MWIFLPDAFLSIVAHRERPDVLLVRARARGDLEALLERLEGEHQIQHTPEADYPYRIEVSRGELALVMEGFIRDELTYDNFKSEVARVAGHERAGVLHSVWATLHELEDDAARR